MNYKTNANLVIKLTTHKIFPKFSKQFLVTIQYENEGGEDLPCLNNLEHFPSKIRFCAFLILFPNPTISRINSDLG